jgi:hypothetical protein
VRTHDIDMSGLLRGGCPRRRIRGRLRRKRRWQIITKEQHDIAVLRLAHAGAIPNTSPAIISEWFRDWSLPAADAVRKIYPPFFEELAALKRDPEIYEPAGLVGAKRHT